MRPAQYKEIKKWLAGFRERETVSPQGATSNPPAPSSVLDGPSRDVLAEFDGQGEGPELTAQDQNANG